MELVEADKYFSSAADVCTSMPYELSYSFPARSDGAWVFWCRHKNELQSILRFISPGFETTKEKIKLFLQSLLLGFVDGLIQFWAPVKIADKIYLTTADQPFSLNRNLRGFPKGLCSYRKLCLENILIPVDVDELGGEEHNFGLPGRVFRHRIPEIRSDINDYFNKEYLWRDRALELGIRSSMALPVFESVGQDCIGVLEIISKEEFGFYIHNRLIKRFEEKLKEMHLTCGIIPSYEYDRYLKASHLKARQVMEHAVVRYKLPLAQLWFAGSNRRWISMISREYGGQKIHDSFLRWISACWNLAKGKGVVGKAFSSGNACFCKDISILSINFYHLVPFARRVGLSSCFAICLKSNDEVGESYILEFFLPRTVIDFGNSISFVRKIVVWLSEEIRESSNSPIQGLEKRLLVKVIKVSSDQDEPDSFEICAATSPYPVPKYSDGREIMPLGSLHQHVGDSKVMRNNSSGEPTDLLSSTLMPELHHNQAGGTVQQSQTVEEPPRPVQPGDESESSNSIGNSAIVRSNPDLSDEQLSLGLHLGLKAWPIKLGKDSYSSSSSVGDYPLPVIKEKPVFSGKLQLNSGNDSDSSNLNAFVCILKGGRR